MTAYLLKSYMRAALRRLTLHPSSAFRWRPSTENCRADIPTNGSPAGVIKKIRKQKHMTQDALAEELGGGCTNKTISRYETGKVEMGIQTLFDVAEALEVPVDKLVPDRLQVHMEEEEKSRRELLAIVGSLGTEDVEALLMVARRFEVPQRKAV